MPLRIVNETPLVVESMMPKLLTPPKVMPRFALSEAPVVTSLRTPPSMTILLATKEAGAMPSALSEPLICNVPFSI